MMSLRTKFLLFVSILHVIALVLSYFVFEDKLFFIAAELLIVVSLALCWQLYRGMIRPLQTLLSGVEAMKSKDFNVKFLHTGSFEMDQVIDVYNGMMDHLREERTRQEQQHFFLEKLIHSSPTGIIIADFDGRLRQVNPKACTMLGLEQEAIIGRALAEIDSPVMLEIARLQPGESKTITLGGVHTYKLQRSQFIDRGFPRAFVMVEELTAEILAAEKKAYGKVIRMMAHEVNNSIGPVNSIIQSALKMPAIWEQENTKPVAHALQVALDRNQNLNLFMRNFADVVRLPDPVRKTVQLQSLITNVITLMQIRADDKRIGLQCTMPEAPIFINADQQQLEQAFINIVKNALEAIGGEGAIHIRATASPKSISITDSGAGITGHNAEHLFSPFFSTKKDGQGVGLTLVKDILVSHGYEFSLTTVKPGETVFFIGLQ